MKMKLSLLACSVLSFLVCSSSYAQSATPTATPTVAPTAVAGRTLTCDKKNVGKLEISLCGIKGCPATITRPSKTPTSYTFNRKKNSDGSLSYTPRVGSKNKCNVEIGALRSGIRPVISASCLSGLKGASCSIQ